MQPRIFLASQSPRRLSLLKEAGLAPIVIRAQSQADAEALEVPMPDENPANYVIRVARLKLNEGLRMLNENQSLYPFDPHDVVIAADTTVALDGNILGKPKDKTDAHRMLLSLSGQIHQVHTAVCCSLANGEKQQSRLVSTEVRFSNLTNAWIEDYIESGEPMDKAGGYGIQGAAGAVISGVTGSYTAVVGLPVPETLELITRLKAN